MKYIFAFLALIILLPACKNLEEQVLYDSKGTFAFEWKEEVNEFECCRVWPSTFSFLDFKGPIDKFWVSNDKLSLSKTGDTLRVDLRDCGSQYDCWGTEFDEVYDFSGKEVLKVTARMEGNMIPTLGISLIDENGYDTNLDRPSRRIMKYPGYIDYYFNYTGKWQQIWPNKENVDPRNIREIVFFVNPGRLNWTGTIFIDKIEAIVVEDMPTEEELKRRRIEYLNLMRQQPTPVHPLEKN